MKTETEAPVNVNLNIIGTVEENVSAKQHASKKSK